MLTSDSKKKLAETVRHLRTRLIKELRDEAAARYRLSVPADVARLPEAARLQRMRLERWLDERVRALGEAPDRQSRWTDTDDLLQPKTPWRRARLRFLDEAASLAAATFLNRLMVLRRMEAAGIVEPPVLTGGLNSRAAKELRDFAPALFADENAGYAWLLGQVFEELVLDLPGLFGDVGLIGLFEASAGTLRATVDALDDKDLAKVWDDDTTLGWTYQYWNDPQREALDAKINDGGKIEGHEIAAKTQMFTERYMVEWLLQNSLGLQWLALCRKNGWTAAVEEPTTTGAPEGKGATTESVLERLENRRAAWRERREKGEVALDALMDFTPDDLEDRWRYYVPQEIPDNLVGAVPGSLRDLKVMDPACGSGHFLVIAFGLLAHLYEEEARHRKEIWSKPQIAQWILEDNLHGIDLDPRAVQIAAAALFIAAREYACADVTPRRLNLVATAFDLARLGPDDAAVVALREGLAKEADISTEATGKIIKMLAGIDTFGSLVKLDKAIDEAVAEAEKERRAHVQGDLPFVAGAAPKAGGGREESPRPLVNRIEQFLGDHSQADDLGVRLDGEQLAAGVRFARMVREGQYHLVVGNPPYQGTAKMVDAAYVAKHYSEGKADLYAAFLLRGLELASYGGLVAMVPMRGWMFLSQFEDFRASLLDRAQIRCIQDIDKGGFESMTSSQLISVVLCTLLKCAGPSINAIAFQPTAPTEKYWGRDRTTLKRSSVLAQDRQYVFSTTDFDVIDGRPIVYWWSKELLREYHRANKLGESFPGKKGLCTGNDTRFIRDIWEIERRQEQSTKLTKGVWAPFINGAAGENWLEPVRYVIHWLPCGMEFLLYSDFSSGVRLQNVSYYFQMGIAFSMIGTEFSARAHRLPSVIGDKGSSVYADSTAHTLCAMNTSRVRDVLQSLNPSISFQVGDVNRLPLFPVESADEIFNMVQGAFSEHEASRETSVEFRQPGRSPWTYAQTWAQRAVDRAPGESLPPYEPAFDPAAPEAHVSFAMGVALGRFGAHGEGLLELAPPTTLPAGILFLSAARERDTLQHPACDGLRAAWSEHGSTIAPNADLRTWLRRDFFDHHKTTYDNRPIWWPLSSPKKTFVAWVAIHRWTDTTLKELLADHLLPEKRALEGEVEDLRRARSEGDKAVRAKAERRYADVKRQLEELEAFVEAVAQCAERGAPPADEKAVARERDATFHMDLDDGVMVNASALWPLLDPQWRDPKKWWKELCAADGRKDYDWSHLAARYFPARVAKKCEEDPSLAVAHGCFWRLHPAKAFAWELRLGAEIRADFTIDEADSDSCRARFLEQETTRAFEAVEKELTRRNRKRKSDEDEGDEAPTAEMPRTLRIAKGQLWALDPARVLALELRWRAALGEGFMIEEPGDSDAWSAWVARDPGAAVEVVSAAVSMLLETRDPRWLRRGYPRDGLVPRLVLARAGLWAAAPREAYAFELNMRATVDTGFVLDEPGADAARARFEGEQALVVKELREAHEAKLADKKVKAALPRSEDAQQALALGAEGSVAKALRKARGKKGVSAASAASTSGSEGEPDA